MLVLKLIGKILLLPVWVILAITWLVVHILVSTFSIFHGFWKAFFTLFTILAIAFGMYQNVVVCICAVVATFLILTGGVFLEILLEVARIRVGRLILVYGNKG